MSAALTSDQRRRALGVTDARDLTPAGANLGPLIVPLGLAWSSPVQLYASA